MARSDNWRINKSSIMAVEGAQVLKSLQKVAGAAGLPKDFKVRFATKAKGSGVDFKTKEVVIGAGRLFHEAPIPADLFDVLVGLTLHEVGHEQIGTEQVDELLTRRSIHSYRMDEVTVREKDLLQKFMNIGEDIVIESRIRANKNLAEYDEALHKWGVDQMRDADPYKLLDVWIEYALGHKSTTVLNLPPELDEPMQQLVALTGWLRKAEWQESYHSGAENRFNSYIQYWNVVKDAILNPPKPEPEPSTPEPEGPEGKPCNSGDPSDEQQNTPPTNTKGGSEPSSDSGAEPEIKPETTPQETPAPDVADESGSSAPEPDDGSEQASGDADGDGDIDNGMDRPLAPSDEDAIDDELADEIDSAVESDVEDVTEQVAEEIGAQLDSLVKSYPVIRSRETKTPLIKPNMILRKKLERIMTIRKRLQARTMHGELYGRIDKRHLHRVATDERIFNLRYKFPDGFPETRILIDLSGSMSGREADEVLEAAGTLQTLVNAEVWCYDYAGNVNLVRVDDGKQIRRFKPAGTTPSGLAIVGVALGMKKGGLVIHLTDGGHNAGTKPWTAHWVLKKKGIDLVNLIWSKHTSHYALPEMNYRELNGLADFPEALYKILVEQTNLQKIGGK